MGKQPCKVCNQVKDWNGDDPQCPFTDGDVFSEDNWNCGLINELMDICYEGNNPIHPFVDYRYCEDMKYATIWIDGMKDEEEQSIGMAVWVAWYKNRGATDAVWILDSRGEPRKPTVAELKRIIKFCKVAEGPKEKQI